MAVPTRDWSGLLSPLPTRDDALAERRSDQGVRAMWPGPASIR